MGPIIPAWCRRHTVRLRSHRPRARRRLSFSLHRQLSMRHIRIPIIHTLRRTIILHPIIQGLSSHSGLGLGSAAVTVTSGIRRHTVLKAAAAVLFLLIASPSGAAMWRCPQPNGGVMFTDRVEAGCEEYVPESGYVVAPTPPQSVLPQASPEPVAPPMPAYMPSYEDASPYTYPYDYNSAPYYDYGPGFYSGFYSYPGWFWSRPRTPFFVVPRHSGPRLHSEPRHSRGSRLAPSPSPRLGSPSFRRGGGHSRGHR